MAKLVEGILGGFRGKVGTVVGAFWKGVATIRAYNPVHADPKTEAQMIQRSKFALIVAFIGSIQSAVRLGFANAAHKMTAFNAALKYNLANAITGFYPNFTVDYTKVLISKGSLDQVQNASAESTQATRIDFTWDLGPATDKISVMAYSPLLKQSVFESEIVAANTGSYNLMVPEAWIGEEVKTYLFATNADGSKTSNSAYAGSVVVL